MANINGNEIYFGIIGEVGGIPLIEEDEWNAKTTEEKQAYGLVAILTSNSGYNRGILVNGEDYQQ